MKTVRFLRDTDPSREGGPGYTAGAIVSLKDDSAKRWVSRSAAEYVKSEATTEVAETNQQVEDDELAQLLGTGPAASDVKTPEENNVNAVEGSADVAEQNGGDNGNGSESDAPAGTAGSTGKATRNRGK